MSIRVDVKSPVSVAIAQAIVEHLDEVRSGKARSKQITYGQLRDRVEAATGLTYATVGSGGFLGNIMDGLEEHDLPLAFTTFVVPKGASLDIEMFERYGITRRNLVEKKTDVLEYDWTKVEFVAG